MVIVKIFLKFYFKSYHDLVSPIIHNISLPNLKFILSIAKLCKFVPKEPLDMFYKRSLPSEAQNENSPSDKLKDIADQYSLIQDSFVKSNSQQSFLVY